VEWPLIGRWRPASQPRILVEQGAAHLEPCFDAVLATDAIRKLSDIASVTCCPGGAILGPVAFRHRRLRQYDYPDWPTSRDSEQGTSMVNHERR